MKKFPVDAPKRKVIRTLELLGFRLVQEKENISMIRENAYTVSKALRWIKVPSPLLSLSLTSSKRVQVN